MKQRRAKIVLTALTVTLLLLLGIPVGRGYSNWRHIVANRELIAAINAQNSHAVVTLLAEGADPNTTYPLPDARPGWRRLWDDIRGRHIDSQPGLPALFLAVQGSSRNREEKVAILRALLKAGADANARYGSNYFQVVLEIANQGQNMDVMQLLIQHGADVNVPADDGQTLLMAAAATGDTGKAAFLIANGAKVDARAGGGGTALIVASQDAHLDTAALLVKHGADINAQDNGGKTPLMYSLYSRKSTKVLQMLLSHGANPNVRNRSGGTALSLAQAFRYSEAGRILKAAGARG